MSKDASEPRSRMLSSIPPSPGLISATGRLLGFVDELPENAAGTLRFGTHGVLFIEARQICWATARGMRVRLIDILRNQSTPPLPTEAVDRVCRQCKKDGKPVGEALVAEGLVSEAGLRTALFKHTNEAVVQLALTRASPDAFVPHAQNSYHSKFSSAPCRILAAIGALDDPARAMAAQVELNTTLVQDSMGAAFSRGGVNAGPFLIAVNRGCDLAVRDLLEICNWSAGLFDLASTFDSGFRAARASWGERLALVTWHLDEVGYVAVCASRAAAARLVGRLDPGTLKTSGVLPSATRHEGGNP